MSEPLNFGRPWLERPDWVARRMVFRPRGRIHGFFGALAVFILVFLALPLAGIAERIFSPADSGLFVLIFGGSLCLALVVALWFGARTVSRSPSKPYVMVCHLRTLPGVIGGWFKADIAATLPETATGFQAGLMCREPSGKYPRLVWETAITVLEGSVRATGGAYRIPVAFQIPALDRYNAAHAYWTLSVVAVSADGIAYNGSFDVPVFDTRFAPSEEQHAPARADAED